VIGALPPTDVAERNRIVFAGPGGKDIDVMPQYYVDYAQISKDFLQRAKTVDELTSRHPDAKPIIEDWMRTHGRTDADVKWVPLSARRATLTMLLDGSSGAVLGAVPVNPW
jgi:hypothetical protein